MVLEKSEDEKAKELQLYKSLQKKKKSLEEALEAKFLELKAVCKQEGVRGFKGFFLSLVDTVIFSFITPVFGFKSEVLFWFFMEIFGDSHNPFLSLCFRS